MPYRRRNYRPRRKRRYRRRRPVLAKNYGRGLTRWNMLKGTGVPAKLTTTLVMTHLASVTTMGGTVYETVYLGNGLYNPLLAESARQPHAYDEITAMYHKYYVSGCRVVVKASMNSPVSASGAQSVIMDVHPSRNPGNNSDILTAIERPNAKYRLLTPNTNSYRLVNYASTRRILGKWKESLQADFNEDPGTLWYWHLVFLPPGSGSYTIDYTIEFYYRVTFYERRSLLRSDEPAGPTQ